MAKPTVRVNGLTMAHEGTGGYVISTLPDVCKSPDKPVPYTNVSYITTLEKGTRTVSADGGNMIAVKGSEQASSVGDEPGIGGGVKSGVNMHRATWLSWSPDVYMEGRPVCRLTDKMLMNKGNTVSIGGHWDPPIAGSDPDLKELCDILCECAQSDQTEKQKCVAERLRENNFDGLYPKPEAMQNGKLPEVSYQEGLDGWRMVESSTQPGSGLPTSRPIVPNSRRPDVTALRDGKIAKIVEMKFGPDKPSPDQQRDYPRIAEDQKLSEEDVTWMDEDNCDCEGWRRSKLPAEEPAKDIAEDTSLAMMAARLLAKGRLASPLGVILEVFKPAPAF